MHTKINEYAKTLPEIDISDMFKDGQKHTMPQDADGLIYEQFQKHLDKKLCANKILFRIPNHQYNHGEYHTIKAKFTQEMKAKIIAKHGEGIFFLNEQV